MHSTSVRQAEVICRSREGREVARVRLFARDDDSPIWQLDPQEARRLGEAAVQLRENGRYEYELAQCPLGWRVQCSVARRSNRAVEHDFGLIETGAHCGLLRIEVVTAEHMPAGAGDVEVRSVKLDYRAQYRAMLSDLSARMTDLLLDSRSSSQTPLTSAWRDEPRYLQQQIEHLRAALDSPAFHTAVQRVIDFPHRRLQPEQTLQSIQKPIRHDRGLIHQIANRMPRMPLPDHHPLAARMRVHGVACPNAPEMVFVMRKTDDLDTIENQFVKFALSSFRDFASRATQALRRCGSSWEVAAERAGRVEHELSRLLSHSFFAGISPLRTAAWGNPVLQRKAGYREVFQTWLRFGANARVEWDASDDLFHAGKRDVAALYEYWLFFQLLDWFCARFDGARLDARRLIEPIDGGRVRLRLKHGVIAGPFEGLFASNRRRLRAQLHYNRVFGASSQRDAMGSWTRNMQPDYTLTFWPAEYELQEAEAQELAVHLHFDAKYRVENLRALFGDEGDEAPADAEPDGERANFKRADLLKMHAYRDAIRRTEGAYVLYPGEAGEIQEIRFLEETGFLNDVMFDSHEVLPSVGAFAIVPGPTGQARGMRRLSEFLDAVLEHLCNRATQREQRTYHTFHAMHVGEVNPPAIPHPLHEKDESGQRALPPFEQLIIVTWNEPEEMRWMLNRRWIAVRLGDSDGALHLMKEVSAASHVLLCARGSVTHTGLFRILPQAAVLLTRADLEAQGYPHTSSEPDDIFAAFGIEPELHYAGWTWDDRKVLDAIEAFERRRGRMFNDAQGIRSQPGIVSLGDLVSAAVFE